MSNFNRIAIAALAGLTFSVLAVASHAGGAGQTALSKCVDSVVAACNKKSDAAVNPCIDSGISQCEKQHKAQIQLPKPGRGQTTGFVTPGR
jgi:hypothetical protein